MRAQRHRRDRASAVLQPRTCAVLRKAAARSLARPLAVWLAAALALSVAACGATGDSASSPHQGSGIYGSLPPVGTPVNGGAITIGQLTGSTPTYIFPIVPTANASLSTFNHLVGLLFLPLYTGPKGASPEFDYALSLATSRSSATATRLSRSR